MNYEVQQELRKKADQWELNSLRDEVRSLKYHKQDLERKLSHIESAYYTQSSALINLINVMIDSEQFVEINHLHNIKNSL